MSLLKIILWAIIIYLVYNTAKNVMKYLAPGSSKSDSVKVKQKKKAKYNIEREDIIDAHFEEINPEKSDKQKKNS